jgi:hypothetical protein
MNEIERIANMKDSIVSLVYHHMGPTGAQSLYVRTAFDLHDTADNWNVREFAYLATFYKQLYREIENYIESDLAKIANPLAGQMFDAFIDGIASKKTQEQTLVMLKHYRMTHPGRSQFVMEVNLEKNKKSQTREYFLTCSVSVHIKTPSEKRPYIQVQLGTHVFNIEHTIKPS